MYYANNFPMPYAIANLAQTANLSAFDANFGAISGYLANVINDIGSPYGIANGSFVSYIDANSVLNLANTSSNVAIISGANTVQINANSAVFTLGTDGSLTLPISSFDPFHNSAAINVATGGQQLAITANGLTWKFDNSYLSYSAPTLQIPPYGAVLGDVDAQNAAELFTPNTMTYVAMNYGYDQYLWANANAWFIGTNWAANNFDGTLSADWQFDKMGNLTLPTFGGKIMANGNMNAVYIQANTNSGRWSFTNANTLVFPDSTIQYTAFSNSANAAIYNSYGQANSAYGQANLAYTAANTGQTNALNAYGQANNAYAAANNNIPDVFANSGLVLANSANLTFNNTASVNAVVTANGTVGSNISFVVNTSMNLVTLNVSTNTLSVGTSSSATANGYSRLTNGLLFQWGNVSVTSANTTVTFPVPFTNIFQVTATTVQGGIGATGANVNCAAFITTTNATTFNVRTNSATANTVNWMAIGN
jgi:hypothetical protein